MAELALLGTALATAGSATGAAGGLTAAATAGATAAGTGLSLGTALTAATTAASLAGTGLSAAAAAKQAEHQRAIADFNALEMEKSANAERAAGYRRAQEQRERGLRVMSEQRAKGAKSGAGTGEGEGFLDLVEDTAARSDYISELEIAGGEDRARGREGQAAATRWRGKAQEGAGYMKAAGYGLQAADEIFGTLYTKRRGSTGGRYYREE